MMNLKRKTLLATTMIAGLAVMAPSLAWAQNQNQPAQQQEEEEEEEGRQPSGQRVDDIVVTGSRIRRNEYTSSQPIQVITSEQATLEGLADTTEILQSSTAANTATQINNFFTGFVTVGGPGVNTVSLRGLGANRTLVLVNGRRVGPAGVRGTVGPTDLNTIPGSQIERIEVLTDGASSIYGSDAVAGVINIITKKNLDGGFIEVFGSVPERDGGEEVRISGSYGETYDRGYISGGFDYYERKSTLFKDREWFNCPQDQVYSDPTLLNRRDVVVGNDYKCNFVLNQIVRTSFAGSAGAVLARNRRDGDFRVNPGSTQTSGFTGCDIPGWQLVAGGFNSGAGANPALNCSITAQTTDLRRQAFAVYPLYNDRYGTRTAISPVKRYSFSAFGGYDLNPTTEVFFEFLGNRRESSQNSWRQLFPQVSPFHSNNPWGGPFNGQTNTFNGGYFALPVALVNTFSEQSVNYLRGVAGIRGELPLFGKTWDWELAGQYSKSYGEYGGNFFYNDRVEATAGLAAANAGRPFGAGINGGNCDVAVLISATACPAGGVNWFTADFINNGVLPAAQANFINGYETGTTDYIHKYIEGVISGELFTLPAGPVGVALGFQLREEEIDDVPGAEQRRGNLWGQTAAGRTRGSDKVNEAFLELEVPILRNVPFFDSFTVNLSGRSSDYESYGSNTTYKVGLNWAISPEYRIRASKGTSFRAPALYELFLANQTSFLGQANVDPCRNWGLSTNERLRTNCAAQGIPDNFAAPGSSALIITGGGAGVLRPETAEAFSAGLIWTPTFADFSVALDYFDIQVNDQVAQFGAGNIVSACYNAEDFPANPLCTLFTREFGATSPRRYEILTVNDSFVNISKQSNKGLDLNLRYRKEFPFGDFQLNGRFSHILDWTTQVFNASVPTILNSRVGSPENVGEVVFRFDRGDWTGSWAVDWVGKSSNQPFFPAAAANGQSAYLGETVFVRRGTDDYFTHAVSLRKRMDKWTFLVGIQNLFDEEPPAQGTDGAQRIGNTPLASQYDWNGRTGFINIARSF